MPRHPHCLRASAAFWPLNSHTPQPDHPVLAPDPFTQTEYETERIQVPEAKVSIPAVSLPAGVQVWKGIADSVANTHGYLPKPEQTYTPVELPQFNHSGFYGSSKTAQGYSAVTRTEEDTPGIELSFVTKHNLKLIDIGDVDTVNAIRELINTVTPEKVAADPRYYYFLERISMNNYNTNGMEQNKEMFQGIPYGDIASVSCYLERYKHFPMGIIADYDESVLGLDRFGIRFDTKKSLLNFLMNYDDADDDWKFGETTNIDKLFKFYTYLHPQLDVSNISLEEKIGRVCDAYFEIKQHGLNQDKLAKLAIDRFTERVKEMQKKMVIVLKETLANPDQSEFGQRHDALLPFEVASRFSQVEIDIDLVRLIEQFVLKFCYFDGWIYIKNTHAVTTNLNTAARSLTYDPDTSALQHGFHSEIFLTDQGKAKIDYVGYNRFDT